MNAGELTRRWLAALADRDRTTMAALLSPTATLTMPLTLDGSRSAGPLFTGADQVLGYFDQVNTLMPRRTLRDQRLTVAGDTVFLQFDGDFRTADDRPYRNTYVFRFDWHDGRLAAIEEYANPIPFIETFPERVTR